MSSVPLPRHVHRVKSRGRDYFYYQEGRGTPHVGARVRLPDDPQSPEFWSALRQAQGAFGSTPTDTFGALADAFELSWDTRQRKISAGTRKQYRRYLKPARKAWGDLPAGELRPRHVDGLIQKIVSDRPGAANNVLDALKALVVWANGPVELLSHDPTRGVRRFPKGAGHRPWCPIFPELQAEMETWERRPGPYLLQEEGRNKGKPVSTNQMWKAFNLERARFPVLEGAVPHGLRANAVISLRAAGYTALQISDMIGMSVEMVEHYCVYADRKASGQKVLADVKEQAANGTVKPLKNVKRRR